MDMIQVIWYPLMEMHIYFTVDLLTSPMANIHSPSSECRSLWACAHVSCHSCSLGQKSRILTTSKQHWQGTKILQLTYNNKTLSCKNLFLKNVPVVTHLIQTTGLSPLSRMHFVTKKHLAFVVHLAPQMPQHFHEQDLRQLDIHSINEDS